VEPALASFSASAAPVSLGELPAGSYWLVGTNPTLAEDSTKLLTCLGSAETVAACAPEVGDTGDTAADAPNPDVDEPDGCGCDAAAPGAAWGAVLLALGVVRRKSTGAT
jgi:MYXO-CTERM domain-containing protein